MLLGIAIFSALLLISYFAPSIVNADVGGQISHSGGGGGGGSFGGGSSFSGGSSHSGGTFVITDNPVIMILVILLIVYQMYKGYQQSEGQANNHNKVYSNYRDVTFEQEQQAINSILAIDPDFDEQVFKTWAEEVFVTLQQAWTDREWKKIRPFEADSLFAAHSRQLNELIDRGVINVVERVAVRDVKIAGFESQGANETLTVYLKASLRDYYVRDDTHQITEGNPNEEFNVVYELKFVRTAGVKTNNLSGKSVTNCPNCGAPTEITSSGQCPYCKSVITNGEYTFVLASLKALSQTSSYIR